MDELLGRHCGERTRTVEKKLETVFTVCSKDGTILEFHSIESNIVDISNTNRISNQYSVAPNSIRILNGAGTALPASFTRLCFVKFIRLSELVILFCILVCIHIHIRYVRSILTVVMFFIVKSESKRSPGTDFAAEDTKGNIRAILSNRIATKRSNIRNFEYESSIRPILNVYTESVAMLQQLFSTDCL